MAGRAGRERHGANPRLQRGKRAKKMVRKAMPTSLDVAIGSFRCHRTGGEGSVKESQRSKKGGCGNATMTTRVGNLSSNAHNILSPTLSPSEKQARFSPATMTTWRCRSRATISALGCCEIVQELDRDNTSTLKSFRAVSFRAYLLVPLSLPTIYVEVTVEHAPRTSEFRPRHAFNPALALNNVAADHLPLDEDLVFLL